MSAGFYYRIIIFNIPESVNVVYAAPIGVIVDVKVEPAKNKLA